MRRRLFLWRLFATYSAVVLAALIATGGYAVYSLRAYTVSDTAATLDAHVDLAAAALAPLIRRGAFAEADALCKQIGRETGTRITVIRPDGTVVGDSFEAIARMENHADRPEIQTAMQGDRGTHVRVSRTIGERLSYLAVPVVDGGAVTAVVRASLPLAPVEQMTASLYARLGLGAGIALTFAFAAAWFTAGRLAQPLDAAFVSVHRIAEGDYDHRLTASDVLEFARPVSAINQFAARLERRITQANRHRGEGEAILASMVEGVLAVDTQSRVISMNRAAGDMLGMSAALATGLPVEEAAPNREVQRFVHEAITTPETVQAEFSLRARGGDVVAAQGTPLRDRANQRVGALVVLHDVTRLRRLEQVRRDFVANVSNELKTPITAIKGYVESILEDGLDNADRAERSMRATAKHANRLSAIIEDLLALSRIEEDEDKAVQHFDVLPVRDVLNNAARQCAARASTRKIALAVDCDPTLEARINPALLEQAVVNLVDNAVRFSENGGRVEIGAARVDESVLIRVRDYGCGIDPEHLPRIFDRFYQIGSAHSAPAGGTGLGLAIVQHIARAHGGGVRATSTPGEGSTFTIDLPA